MIDYLVLETNPLAAATVDSIRMHDVGSTIKVVEAGSSLIGTAVKNATSQTLVLKSGVIWQGCSDDIPAVSMQYPICAAEFPVFADHPKFFDTYNLAGEDTAPGVKDLSIFVINPDLWKEAPEQDIGVLRNTRILTMPRYMNHKDDWLLEDTIPPHEALYYGVLGESALALNYVGTILRGNVTANETFAYLFDEVAKYTNGLDAADKDFIKELGEKTRSRVGSLRRGLAKLNGVVND